MNPKRLQQISGIICITCFLTLITYCSYHISKGHILIKESSEEVITSSFYSTYEYINPSDIAFIYEGKNKQTTIVNRHGSTHHTLESPSSIINRLSLNGHFMKGNYYNKLAFANAHDVVSLRWEYPISRTYLQFSELDQPYYFDGIPPKQLIQQITSINRNYMLHCRSKDYVNILHLTSCSYNQPCGCTYFKGQSIGCSCDSAKKISRAIEAL